MLGRILRVLIGFALAALAAGLTKVLFAITPAQLSSLPADVLYDRLSKVGEWALLAAIHSAIFAAPFALVGAAIGEWRHLRDWSYYALVAMAIAIIGYLAQYSSEAVGHPTVINNYAMTAYLTTGFVSGVVYWLFSGRFAGGHAHHHGTVANDMRGKPSPITSKPAPGAKPGTGGGSRTSTNKA